VQARRGGAFEDGRQRPVLVPVFPAGRFVADIVRGIRVDVGRENHCASYVRQMSSSCTERAGGKKETVILPSLLLLLFAFERSSVRSFGRRRDVRNRLLYSRQLDSRQCARTYSVQLRAETVKSYKFVYLCRRLLERETLARIFLFLYFRLDKIRRR